MLIPVAYSIIYYCVIMLYSATHSVLAKGHESTLLRFITKPLKQQWGMTP